MNAHRFRITVEADVVTKKIIGKRWEKGGPLCRSENADYGYTPEIESTVSETVKVYEQTVDALDLAALVLVVNKGAASK